MALIVIFIDHVPGNPVARWTLRSYAFCDAAEIFVLISGISVYLAYGAKFERFGLLGCARAVGRRWARIYAAHLAIFAVLAACTWIASRFFATDYVTFLKLNWLFDKPYEAAMAILTLRYLPRYVDILPLYLLLLLAAPGLIALVKRDARLALAVSALVYVAVQLSGVNLSQGNDGEGWTFNPLAWQFLYTIGIVVGHLSRRSAGKARLNGRWLAVAIAFVVFGLVVAAPWTGSEMGIPFFDPPIYLRPAEKTFLSPLRVLNALALLYVFTFFVSREATMLRTKLAAPFLWCGRQALPVYGTGVILSCVGYIALTETADTPGVLVAVNFLGILSLMMLAAILHRRSDGLSRQRLTVRGSDSPGSGYAGDEIPIADSCLGRSEEPIPAGSDRSRIWDPAVLR